MNRQPMGDGFFHDHSIGRKHLTDFVRDPPRIHGLGVGKRQRIFTPFPSPRFVPSAQLLSALAALRVPF